jgi:hypothetical protein
MSDEAWAAIMMAAVGAAWWIGWTLNGIRTHLRNHVEAQRADHHSIWGTLHDHEERILTLEDGEEAGWVDSEEEDGDDSE